MKRVCVAMALMALVGCGTSDTRGTRVTIDLESGEAKIVENSFWLSNRVKVRKVTYDSVGGIRRATVTVESLLKRRQRMQMRMIWVDAEGAEVDADGKAFRPFVLDGADMVTFTGMAPNEKCVRAKMQIREIDTVE